MQDGSDERAGEVNRAERGLGLYTCKPDSNVNQLGRNHLKKYYSSSESNDDRSNDDVLHWKRRRKCKGGISYRKHLLLDGRKSPTKPVPSISALGPNNDGDFNVTQDQSSSSRIDNEISGSAESINQSHDSIRLPTPTAGLSKNPKDNTLAMTIFPEAPQQILPIPVIVSLRQFPERTNARRKRSAHGFFRW